MTVAVCVVGLVAVLAGIAAACYRDNARFWREQAEKERTRRRL